jgi:DNA polymerase I-like protein with 3'-5' exonuclease and polymerase domains
MVGYFMNNPSYIALARKGVHDFLTCYELGIPFTKDAITAYKEKDPKVYKTTRDKCKRVVHGVSYGMGPWLMTELYPETFPRLRDARRMQDKLFKAIPDLPQWQHETMVRAQKDTFLKNPWGHRHRFYDVFTQTAEGKIKKGKDAKRAIAYLPQSSAGSFMRDNLILIGESEWGQYMPANVSVHDGYVLDVPDRDGIPEAAVDFLVKILTRPIDEMGGLQIGCAVERGINWRHMDEIKVVTID